MRRSSAERQRLRAAKSRNRNRRYNNYLRNFKHRQATRKILFQMVLQELDAAVLYGATNLLARENPLTDAIDAIAAIWELHPCPAPAEHERGQING